MLKATSGIGICSQQKFTNAALLRLTGVTPDQLGRIISTCIQRKTTPGQAIDVEVALGVVALALCFKLRVDVEELACAQGPMIRSALTHLASDPQNWNATGEEGELSPFRNLFCETQGVGVRHRSIQELLGIQGTRTFRYLVRSAGEAWSGSDDIPEKIGAGKEPFVFIVDSVAVADKLSTRAAGPFFTWKP